MSTGSPRSPFRYGHRVQKDRPATPSLPKDRYRGAALVTAEGVVLESIWDGKGPLPWQGDWPQRVESMDANSVPARIHLPRVR